MYLIKNSKKSKNVVFLDIDKVERVIRYAVQTNVPAQNFGNILKDCTISISNEMKDFIPTIINQVRTEGKELKMVDLAEYKGEEFNIKFSIFNDVYGAVRASTAPALGRDGKFNVGVSWQGISKINTNENANGKE